MKSLVQTLETLVRTSGPMTIRQKRLLHRALVLARSSVIFSVKKERATAPQPAKRLEDS